MEAMSSADVLIGYVSYSAAFIFELLLFFLALWAGVQCSRGPSSSNWFRARHLRLILVEGNALYFLAWVASLVHLILTDVDRQMAYQAAYLVVFFTSSVRYQLSHETINLRTLVASISQYRIQCLSFPIHRCRLLSYLAYSNCSCDIVFHHACLTKKFERTEPFNHSLSWSNYLRWNPVRIMSISLVVLSLTSVVGPLSYFISPHTVLFSYFRPTMMIGWPPSFISTWPWNFWKRLHAPSFLLP